jgi:hypothetical protein
MGIYCGRVSANRAGQGILQARQRSAKRGGYSALFRPGELLVKTRLATIGRVAMNDPTLGRFVDGRNNFANLIGRAFWRGAGLLLQSAQVRLNTSITGRSSKCLSGAFTC